MSEEARRSVGLERLAFARYEATNARGGKLAIGSGEDSDFTPVELLLAAIAGCSAIDVDHITSKRSEPDQFEVQISGNKIRGDAGNCMTNLTMTFNVAFPDDEGGAKAHAVLPRAVAQSHDRLCTVSRTVEIGTPIAVEVNVAGE